MNEPLEGLLVSTERLGWPRRRWWHLLPWEDQRRLVYDDQPDEPTAACHLQVTEEQDALCGLQREGLVIVPGHPS